MAAGKKSNVDPEKLEHYRKLVVTVIGAEVKGASVPYTSENGNMYSYLHETHGLALRLPAAERERFLEAYDTKLFEAYGIVQKEYVAVPDALLMDTETLAPWFEISYAYVRSLKPKPTKKPAKPE